MFSFFLTLSFIIWLLNAMGKNYTSIIDYPVAYTNFPDELVFIGELPDKLNLRVDAVGYSLFRYKLIGRPEPITFNVSSFAMSRVGNDTTRTYILTRYIRDQVSRQLPSELQLLDIKPDSLLFRFARMKSKMVPVESSLIFEVDKQFTVKDKVILTPDSLLISGPDFMIDTISSIKTKDTNLGQLTKSFSGKVELSGLENISMGTVEVDCLIELERFTEVQFYIPLEAVNLPDTMNIQTFPSRVKVICNVGLSQYDRIDKNMFRATVDYTNIVAGNNRLQVNLLNIPLYVRSFDYNPRTVEYLLSEK